MPKILRGKSHPRRSVPRHVELPIRWLVNAFTNFAIAADIVLNRSDRVYELSMRGNARENPLSSFRRPVCRGITLHRHRKSTNFAPCTHVLMQIYLSAFVSKTER